MKIKIKTVDNNEITINIEDFKMTIQDLINLIKKKHPNFKSMENLVWTGKILDKTKTISETGIKNNDTLICLGCLSNKKDEDELLKHKIKYYQENGLNEKTMGFCLEDLIDKFYSCDLIQNFKKQVLENIESFNQDLDIQQGIKDETPKLSPIKVGGSKKKKKKSKRKKTKRKKIIKRKKAGKKKTYKKIKKKLIGGSEQGPGVAPSRLQRLQFRRKAVSDILREFVAIEPEFMVSITDELLSGSNREFWTKALYLKSFLFVFLTNLTNLEYLIRVIGSGDIDWELVLNTLIETHTHDKSRAEAEVEKLQSIWGNSDFIEELKEIINQPIFERRGEARQGEYAHLSDTYIILRRIIWLLWTSPDGLYLNINHQLRNSSIQMSPILPHIIKSLSETCKLHETSDQLYRVVVGNEGDFWIQQKGLLHYHKRWGKRRECLKPRTDKFVLYEPSFISTSSDKDSGIIRSLCEGGGHHKVLFIIQDQYEVDEETLEVRPVPIKTSPVEFQAFSYFPTENEILLDHGGCLVTNCFGRESPIKWIDRQEETQRFVTYLCRYLPKGEITKYAFSLLIVLLRKEYFEHIRLLDPGVTDKNLRDFNIVRTKLVDIFKQNKSHFQEIFEALLEITMKLDYNDMETNAFSPREKTLVQELLPSTQTRGTPAYNEFMESCITLNAHGDYNEQTIEVPGDIEILVPHHLGTAQPYTVEDLRMSYEEILYSTGIFNFEMYEEGRNPSSEISVMFDKGYRSSGWKLYKGGDHINNVIFEPLTTPCDQLPEVQKPLLDLQSLGSGYLLNYCLDEHLTPISFNEKNKLKIKICNRVDLGSILSGLKDKLQVIPIRHFTPDKTYPVVRLIIFACNAKSEDSENVVLKISDNPTFNNRTLFDEYLELNTGVEDEFEPEPEFQLWDNLEIFPGQYDTLKDKVGKDTTKFKDRFQSDQIWNEWWRIADDETKQYMIDNYKIPK